MGLLQSDPFFVGGYLSLTQNVAIFFLSQVECFRPAEGLEIEHLECGNGGLLALVAKLAPSSFKRL